MATKKVKKFSRGGDILTGLGAGLAAYGAYKHFFGKDDQGKDTKTGVDKGVEEGKKKNLNILDEVARENARKDAENKKDESKNAADDRMESALKTYRGITSGGSQDSGGSDEASTTDSASVSTNGKKPAPRNAAPRKAAPKKEPAKDRTAEFANLYQGLTTAPKEAAPAADTRLKPADVSGVGSNVLSSPAQRRKEAAARERAAKDRLAKFEEKRRESKEREARRIQAQNKAKSGTSLKAPGSRLRAPGSKVDLNDPYSMTLGGDLDPKAMMRRNSRLSGDTEFKKGGKVKKYASGGSVKRSASARADGIAIRGKTRA